MNNFSIKFRKILNDLKRRPEDAARELKINVNKIKNALNKNDNINFEIIKKAVKIWPVNYSDFFSNYDDTKNNFKILRKRDSDKTTRIMIRNNFPYYKYKDTVMSKVSPFRPEWIEELKIVDNNSPNNPSVAFNNGHFLHQFTYFIGPVNFYYIDHNNKKKVYKMNSGDSMYISPYIPHSFTTRRNTNNINGVIIALTYTDKIDNEILNELSVIGHTLQKKSRIKVNKKIHFYNDCLKYYMNITSCSKEYFESKTKLKLNKIFDNNDNKNYKKLKIICNFFNISMRDFLPIENYKIVKINRYKKNRIWKYPSNRNNVYKFIELTNVAQLPVSRALELNITNTKDHNHYLTAPSHQYLYNIGQNYCYIFIDNKKIKFMPGDSIYLKPNVKHKFIGKSKILILRIGGKIYGEVNLALSHLSENNFYRLIKDNRPWYN
jgi:methylphosphonate synthase